MAGHALARRYDDEANYVGVFSWVAAGVCAALIDRSVPARAVAVASLGLPLVWFGTLIVSEDHGLWMFGLAFLVFFAIIAGLSAAVTKRLLTLFA